jgi:hypothetical protein
LKVYQQQNVEQEGGVVGDFQGVVCFVWENIV